MRTSCSFLALSVAAALVTTSAQALTVGLNPPGLPTQLSLDARHAGGTPSSGSLFPIALPYVQSPVQTTAHPSTYAASDYDLSNTGFHITFDLSRSNALGDYAFMSGFVSFILDQSVDYVASGWLTAVDSSGREVGLDMQLFDTTIPTTAFQSRQTSTSTPNESFVLGGTGGDSDNVNTGSLTGTLEAGHIYHLFYGAFTFDSETASTGATATGSIKLAFVPEPGSGILTGLGLLAIAVRQRRARNTPASG